METIIVALIVAGAAAYVGRSLYKQFRGKAGCSSGCTCTPEVEHHCKTTPQFLDDSNQTLN